MRCDWVVVQWIDTTQKEVHRARLDHKRHLALLDEVNSTLGQLAFVCWVVASLVFGFFGFWFLVDVNRMWHEFSNESDTGTIDMGD